MKYSLIILAGIIGLAWAPPPAPSFCGAQSLCTIFARNNGGSVGGAVYFDVTAVSDIDICGYDINTAELTAAGLEVWTTPGTYVGNEANPGLWTQVAVDDGTGMGMGNDIPTPITLLTPFTLPAGSWGMALVAVGVGHDYTTGGASSTLQYTDGTITIDLGSATNVPFTGTPFSPRIWNGCIHYSGGAEPGVGYCSGESGSGTRCPCNNNNDGSVPGAGCANGVFASGALLTGSGVASVSADTVVLHTEGLEPDNYGLYFQAFGRVNGGAGSFFGDGLRCAGANMVRLEVVLSDGAGASSTSVPIASVGNVAAGTTKRYQCWYRTIVNPPCGLVVNDFNMSNGYEITWLP